MAAVLFAPDSAESLTAVEARAVTVAAVLRGRGVEPGDRVLLKAGNSAGYVTVLLALMHAGASIVLVDHGEQAEQTSRICRLAGVRVSVVDDDAAMASQEPHLYVYDLLATAAGRTAAAEPFDAAGWARRRDGLVMWSSGSTGSPKGVVKTGASFLRNLERNATHMGHRPGDVLLPLLPFSHQYGLSMVLIAWQVRCSLVVAPYRRLDRALRMAGQTGATVIDATPATYRSIHNLVTRRGAGREDLATVRLFCSGAAPLDPTLVDKYVDMWGLPLLDSYGSTELGNVAFATADNAVAAGRPVEDMGVRVVDDAGAPVPAGHAGEILVDSPDLMEGYLGPDGAVQPVTAGWQRTGDLGHLDTDGNLHVIGRKLAVDRMGYTLYPEVIERTLAAGGCSAKVIALPDERRGCTLVCFVEDEQGRDQRYWRERIDALLPAYERPNQVSVLDRLPLNGNGKPDRRRLERIAAEQDVLPVIR